MIADAMTSIKAYLYEKSTSPLLGSLVISWCAWNYKFLLMLVSGLSFPDKLRYINILYSNDYECYFQGMLLPLLTSILYLFVFPYPAQFVYKFSLGKQKALNELKNQIQENELLTLEQSRAIRNQLAEREKYFEELIERKDRALEDKGRELEAKDKEVRDLQKSLFELEEEYDELSKNKSVNSVQYNSNEQLEEKVIKWISIGNVDSPQSEDEYYAKILSLIYDAGGSMYKSDITSYFQNKTKVNYYMDDLQQRRYLIYSNNEKLTMSHEIKGLFVSNT
ncbi:hypothetical protein [Photobacterium leiognathi]|uniref:hypothetical protein n=1 Tax=Photobacterium leiognathi TaxID=553611 RepID=UPI0029822BDD|nr:hypothetical protein [Photobacterium leiognathi]